MEEWLSYRQEFLSEIHCLESRIPGNINLSCDTCHDEGQFRYRDCFGGEILCRGCILLRHAEHPLHSLQVRPLRVFVFYH